CREIKAVAWQQRVVGPAAVVGAVGDEDAARADNRRDVALDDERGAFVDPDAEKPGIGRDDLGEVALPAARADVLIDRDIAEIAEPALRAGRHQGSVVGDGAAYENRPLNRRAGRASGDQPAALEHGPYFALGAGAGIGVDETPLPAADKPHRGRRLERRD